MIMCGGKFCHTFFMNLFCPARALYYFRRLKHLQEYACIFYNPALSQFYRGFHHPDCLSAFLLQTQGGRIF